MVRYLNTPYRTKYKFYHFRLSEKGRKGVSNVNDRKLAIKVRNKVSWILNPKQIEIVRRMFARRVKAYNGFMDFIVFPDLPKTKKSLGLRMGKGKGAPEYWVAPVKPGRILFEAEGVPMDVAKEALRLAAQKLPVVTKFVVRRDYSANA